MKTKRRFDKIKRRFIRLKRRFGSLKRRFISWQSEHSKNKTKKKATKGFTK